MQTGRFSRYVLFVIGMLAACGEPPAQLVAPEPPRVQASVVRFGQPLHSRRIDPDRKDTPWQRMADIEFGLAVEEARGRVIIGLKDPSQSEGVDNRGQVVASARATRDAKDELRSLGVVPVYEFKQTPVIVATLSAEQAVALRRHPRVDYIEPSLSGTWATQTTPWGVTRIQAPTAWFYSTGSGVKVLVLDSGVDSTARDLSVPVSWRCVTGPIFDYTDGHGTFMAGVIGALNNTTDVVGVAYSATLWSANISGQDGHTPDPAEAACSVEVARVNSISIVNMSFNFGSSYTSLTDQINAGFNNNDMLFVGASGNDGGSVHYPASLSNVIAVGATDSLNALWSSSATGAALDLTAPGVAVLSTALPSVNFCSNGGAYTAICSGTSISAAHVSGAAAVLRARYPTWSNTAIRDRLLTTATDLGSAGFDNSFGYGLVDLYQAISMQVGVFGVSTAYEGVEYTWTPIISGGQSPYSYQWYVEGVGAGTGSSLVYTPGATGFTITLIVTDYYGATATGGKVVTVVSCSPNCS